MPTVVAVAADIGGDDDRLHSETHAPPLSETELSCVHRPEAECVIVPWFQQFDGSVLSFSD